MATPRDAVLSFRVTPGEGVIAGTRGRVRERLSMWSLPATLAEDVVQTTHELVINAVEHGEPPIDFRMVHTGSEVVVEVRDRSSSRPRARRPEASEEHGRGLQVVEALASGWGTRMSRGVKTVWCRHAITGLRDPVGR